MSEEDIKQANTTPVNTEPINNKKIDNIGIKQVEPVNECIRVNKVYDWVTLSTDKVQEIPIPAEGLTAIETATTQGHQLLVTGTIDLPDGVVTNIVNVVRKTVLIDGNPVEVGCAQILKTVTLNISIFDATEISDTPITTFESSFQILERAGLCFPPSFTMDNITLTVTRADTISLSDIPVNGEFLFEVRICQELQVETEVMLEVLARYCEPRDNTINCGSGFLGCPKPTFPDQCPDIFPLN